MILRLPTNVELFNENGESVAVFNSTKKSQIRLRLHATPRTAWAFGTCRVYYNKPHNFWNEFRFTNISQLETGLVTVTEKPLVDFLEGVIPQEYLEKRQLSPAQQQAIARARSKSTMGGKS